MRYFFTVLLITFSVSLLPQTPENFGELLHSVDLGSQTPTPDRNLVGIQYAEGNLWVTGFDPDDYWQHKLYKFNSDGSELIETYSYGIEAAGWKDLAYDGEFLYVTDMDTIRQISIENGEKTGVKIPAPFYYNRGLAYNPYNDHFYVSGEGGFNIYEIDRDGTIQGAIPGSAGNYYVGLAVDTISPGGPFLWAYTNEEQGFNLVLKGKQVALSSNQFTGVEFEGASISSIIQETAGGATISYDYAVDTLTLITINIRNGNANDQMEYAMFYDITRDAIPGPQISVDPTSVQNLLMPGDTAELTVNVFNNGDAPLTWSAYIETPDQDTVNNLGELMSSFNATSQTPDNDRGLNAITFLDDKIWINGRNFPNDQSAIYEFDKNGMLLQIHPYFTVASAGFRSLTSDGAFLYAEDTYTINQIDPETFATVDIIIKPSGSFSGLTYDPQTDHFWGGNGNGLIYEFNRDGDIQNEYLTPFNIEGLAWDNWSPGGPFLWAWVETENENGSQCEAIRLDPHTCTPVGDGFVGFNFSNDTIFADTPKAAVITDQLEENKVSLIAIHNVGIVTPTDTTENIDYVANYDLDVVPPPDWIGLSQYAYGVVTPGDSNQFFLSLNAIMDDTVMTASIRISNNDVLQPEVVIPVNFEMSSLITDVEELTTNDNILGNNFPNPSYGQTFIPVRIEKDQHVALNIYSLSGRLVKEVVNKRLPSGEYLFPVAINDLKPGIYIYSLSTKRTNVSKKLIIKD